MSSHGGAVRGRPCLGLRFGIGAQVHELGDRNRVAQVCSVEKRSAAMQLTAQSNQTSKVAGSGPAGGTSARAQQLQATNPRARMSIPAATRRPTSAVSPIFTAF